MSELTLWCYYREHGALTPFHIMVQPDMVVDGCKKLILQARSGTPSDCADLYQIPLEHPVLVNNVQSTLGKLSVSDLGQPLSVERSMQEIFGPSPEGDRLHLVLVDHGMPLKVRFSIPTINGSLLFDVKEDSIVDSFLPAIKAKYPVLESETDFTYYKTPCKRGEVPGTVINEQLLSNVVELFSQFDDVPFSLIPCVTVQVVRLERKHHLSWVPLDRATKRQRIENYAPSELDGNRYCSLQASNSGRILDYRVPFGNNGPLPDNDLPPIEVLFDGFGKFLDISRGVSIPSSNDKLEKAVDDFVLAMSQVYDNEEQRNGEGLGHLNKIFGQDSFRSVISTQTIALTGKTNPPRTDGHSYCGDRIPCILVKFKNEVGDARAIPSVELSACYHNMVKALYSQYKESGQGSRLPALGITIVGPMVKFFAFAYVGAVVCVPLTGAHWCLPLGTAHQMIRTAFQAASVLVGSIQDAAKQLVNKELEPIRHPFFPQINRLTTYQDSLSDSAPASSASQHFDFKITGLLSKNFNQHLYSASSESCDLDLVIKLTRSYSPELHLFCARHGFAPQLYACERLAGGIIAVAMGRVWGTLLAPTSDLRLREKWTKALHTMVATMHNAGYVHGDLRPPNITCTQDRLVLLDFDWGGKVGAARYPHTQLHAQLTTGRDMTCLEITKEDDERVLKRTLDFICEKDNEEADG